MLNLQTNRDQSAGDARERRSLLGIVHVGAKELGMCDDDYRAFLSLHTGHSSARDCSLDQLRAVISEMRKRGFAGGAPRPTARANNPIANKARAMWISLYQLGAIDDPSEKALEAFARRQLGVDRLAWIDQRRGDSLIEALKAMAEREGWEQSVPARLSTAKRIRLLKERLCLAQLAKLERLGSRFEPYPGWQGPNFSAWTEADLETVAHEFGKLVRQAVNAQ